MDVKALTQILSANSTVIQQLTHCITSEQARWKPDEDRWSILAIVNHLVDEECEDFRLHLDIMLHRPTDSWPSIDPFGWITERKYNERDLTESVTHFAYERQKSLSWLACLDDPNWESTVQASWGPFKAGDMFASWVVHDQWHIQQLVQVRRDLCSKLALPYHVKYAGTLST